MKTKKILISTILIIALAVGVVACTASEEESEVAESSAAESGQPPADREEMGAPPEDAERPEVLEGEEPPEDAERPERPADEDRPESSEEGQPSGMIEPDFAAAAEQLGVSEEALREAFGEPGESEPDFAAIAEELGVTEEALFEAMGGDQQPGGRPEGQPGGDG